MSVYIVECVGTDFVKIGYTDNNYAEDRISSMRTGCPFELKLKQIIVNAPVAYEKALHRKFEKKRVRGEWFLWDDEMRDYFSKESNWENQLPLISILPEATAEVDGEPFTPALHKQSVFSLDIDLVSNMCEDGAYKPVVNFTFSKEGEPPKRKTFDAQILVQRYTLSFNVIAHTLLIVCNYVDEYLSEDERAFEHSVMTVYCDEQPPYGALLLVCSPAIRLLGKKGITVEFKFKSRINKPTIRHVNA
jgi:hypothetical protein